MVNNESRFEFREVVSIGPIGFNVLDGRKYDGLKIDKRRIFYHRRISIAIKVKGHCTKIQKVKSEDLH